MTISQEDKFDVLCYARGFNASVAENLGFDESSWESDAVIRKLDEAIESKTGDLLANDFGLAMGLMLGGERPDEELLKKVALNSYAEGLKKEDRKLSLLMEAFGKAAVTEHFLTMTQMPKEDASGQNAQEQVTFWADMKNEYSGNNCEALESIASKKLAALTK